MKKISQWFGGRRAGASSMSALEETCQHYAAKLEALAHVLSVIEFNPQGLILEVNPQFLRVSGYGQQDLIGQPHHILLPEHAKASSGDVFWSSLAAGKVAQGEYQFRTQSGQELWLQASYTPILDAAGQLVKVLMFASDITLQKQQQLEFSGRQAALDKVLGVIEFSLDGHILALNHNFEHVTGYTAAELVGQHHRLLMPPEVVSTAAYQQFWQRLAQGQADSGVYKRIGKHGQEIWLQASYNPIFDVHGKPYKVVKYATDITLQKQKEADDHGQINAIHHIMAVIEFDLTGHVVDANEHFLRAVGYERSEIVGQHHRMFVPTEQRNSPAYQQFWQALAQGNAQSGLFQRVNKAGHSLWLNASYIPIVDLNGKPYKVVKYATDVTQQHQKDIDNAGQIDSINRSLGTIEFSLDGQIQKVNQNFLNVVGYDASEVIGQYHRLFMPEHAGQSAEYQSFWKKLAQGQFQAGVFKRKGKQGQDIWLQASYNPVLNDAGQPIKVVKFAIDITSQKVTEIGLIQAVAETQRLLEFAQQGDMTARIDLHGKTEQILNLSRGINALMDMVSQILLQFKTSADMINTAAHEISSGNIDLSTRTEKQAHSLQDTAASMEQLASTVKQNADSAKQANQLAVNATKVAERGSNAMHEVVSTMNAINDSAKKIEDIISVIDSIAFQTNILALNAAVEAARAGDQGKGFAVVAGEVRNLAQRSASAAKEIKELITDSVNKTTEGSNLVTGAGATMTEIMQSVQHVSAIISDISTASMEQTSGIDQVNLAISSMDDVTQQNAALVEEAAATAESLVEQASQLSEIVSGFKLELAHGQTGALTSAKSTGTYD